MPLDIREYNNRLRQTDRITRDTAQATEGFLDQLDAGPLALAGMTAGLGGLIFGFINAAEATGRVNQEWFRFKDGAFAASAALGGRFLNNIRFATGAVGDLFFALANAADDTGSLSQRLIDIGLVGAAAVLGLSTFAFGLAGVIKAAQFTASTLGLANLGFANLRGNANRASRSMRGFTGATTGAARGVSGFVGGLGPLGLGLLLLSTQTGKSVETIEEFDQAVKDAGTSTNEFLANLQRQGEAAKLTLRALADELFSLGEARTPLDFANWNPFDPEVRARDQAAFEENLRNSPINRLLGQSPLRATPGVAQPGALVQAETQRLNQQLLTYLQAQQDVNVTLEFDNAPFREDDVRYHTDRTRRGPIIGSSTPTPAIRPGFGS